ncbi:chromosome partitioning protein ParB [Methanosarcinales archaeon ex4484_138]|nr:MAG: chromosome partitioning protein ParB [Methanosarcinales archaeon ex4484_138]
MNITMPCQAVQMVPREMVVVNNYNPNHVSPDKMRLLMQSIIDNGFCYAIVTIWDDDLEKYVVIDGGHRRIICEPEWLDIDPIPIIKLNHNISQRMAATIQFNKARGVHQVDLDAEIIRALSEQGLNINEISKHLGIDEETIYRYKQLTGIAELFKNAEYSTSWEVVDNE